MSTQNLQLEDLLDLREELRSAGFDPGLQRTIVAHNLLLALAAQGRLPDDPHEWRTWLAPVFCSARSEQEEFYRRFAGWVERHAALAAQAKAAAAQASTPEAIAGDAVRGNSVRSSAFRRLLSRFKPARLKAELRTWLRWFARPQVWGTAVAMLVVLAGLDLVAAADDKDAARAGVRSKRKKRIAAAHWSIGEFP